MSNEQQTDHVDVGPLLQQADYQVPTKCPGGHVQRRHSAAVDGIDVGAVAGQDVHCSLRRVAHAQVESRLSFHLDRGRRGRNAKNFCYFKVLKDFVEICTRASSTRSPSGV